MIVRLNVVLRRGLGRDRSDRRDDGRSAADRRPARRPAARRSFCTADGARERHDVDRALEQHPVDVRLALAFGVRHDRAVGDHFGHLGAVLPQFLGDHLASDVGARQQDLQAPDVARLGQGAAPAFRRGTRRERDRPSGRGARAARRSPDRPRTARTPPSARRSRGEASSRCMNASTALALEKTIQSNRLTRAHASSSGP